MQRVILAGRFGVSCLREKAVLSDFDLAPLGDDLFLNVERRCPVVLVQDTSSSMRQVIQEVNQGLADLRTDLVKDPLASQRVELALVTFGPVLLAQDFMTVDQWMPPRLSASGATPLGEALLFSLEQLRMRRRAYQEAGVPHYRPWMWIVTDGAPTDNWRSALEEVRKEVDAGKLEVFTIGASTADFRVLKEISSPRAPMKLREAKYREMFLWLSQSLKPVSRAAPGAEIDLMPPGAWGETAE